MRRGNPLKIPEPPGDCHTSDIGHWFAMTPCFIAAHWLAMTLYFDILRRKL